jgi:hypothetical protein
MVDLALKTLGTVPTRACRAQHEHRATLSQRLRPAACSRRPTSSAPRPGRPGCDQKLVLHQPRLISDDGPCYIADLCAWMAATACCSIVSLLMIASVTWRQ